MSHKEKIIASFDHPMEKALLELISEMDREPGIDETNAILKRICGKYNLKAKKLVKEFNAIPEGILEATARLLNDTRH